MVARSKFAGTHLADAALWLLEIEDLMMGGWRTRRMPRMHAPEKLPARQRSGQRPGRSPSKTPEFKVPRVLRIGEPRPAPRPVLSERHHHFEHKAILASPKGAPGVAERRAAYGEGFNAPGLVISSDARATIEAAYEEGSRSTDAERVVHVVATNGDTFEDRMSFWKLANENANFVGEHKVTVATAGVESAWDAVAKDPTMPDILREALADARAAKDGAATRVVNDAGVIKRWLAKKTRSFPDELRPKLALETFHNDRVAYGIVGQFNHRMSLEGMKSCLGELVAEFRKRGIPCSAVIHEPTAKNSEKNWHFHLIYYAGPAERLADGRWSFQREYRRDRWGTMKWVPLKRLKRNEDVAAPDWVPKLKKRWENIINRRAELEGIATRFTSESNKERGLPKPQTRYTPARQALRKQGFFTDAEIDLNIASWREWEKRKKAKFLATVRLVRETYHRLSADPRVQTLSDADQGPILERLDGAETVLGELDAAIGMVVQSAKIHKAVTSGSKDIIAHYGDRQKALNGKKPTAVRDAQRFFANVACKEAEAYMLEIKPELARLETIHLAALQQLDDSHKQLKAELPFVENQIEDAIAADTRRAASVSVVAGLAQGSTTVATVDLARVVDESVVSHTTGSGKAASIANDSWALAQWVRDREMAAWRDRYPAVFGIRPGRPLQRPGIVSPNGNGPSPQQVAHGSRANVDGRSDQRI